MPKPFGYWKDFRNVKRELEPIIEKLDEFPTQKQLYEIRRGDIVSAMQDHHGGISTVRKRMGYELKRKPVGYWEDFENLKRELEPIIEELGDFPKQKQLKQMGKSDILSAMYHHGGLNEVRKRLGYELLRKPDGYWDDFENVKRELEPIIEKLGEFPRDGQLRKMGKSDLATAIGTYHGGLNAVREKMGYELFKRKPDGYWDDFENVRKELEPILEELGYFPTAKQLEQMGGSDIIHAIYRYHGSLNAVREKMGYELFKRKPDGYWDDFENLKRELEPIIEELGDFPTLSQLKKIKRWDIERAINNHHDGINFVRKKMGFKLKRKPKGYWQDFENVRKELELIIEELGEFPSQNQLKKMGRSSLATAIHKYHGGFPALRKRMSYELKRKPDGYWEDFENLKKELEPILEKLGEFPTCSQLRKMGRSDIGYAIHKYHGGFPALRERMGYKPIGTKEELLRFVEEHEESKKLLTLGLSHFRYLKDAIDILTRLFPKRIDPNKTMEIIDSSIEPLRAYLGGFEVTKTYDCIPLEFLESIPPSLFKIKEFESLLFDVAQDSYQKDFNKDPRGTIETLKTQIKRIDNPIVRRLLKRVLKFYKEVLYYDIPGIKPLVDKRGEKVIK